MGKDKRSLRVHSKDTNATAKEKNEKLIEIIGKLEKENKELKSRHKTMEVAWANTEEKYKEAVNNIPLREIIDSVKTGVSLKKRDQCNKCGAKKIKRIPFDGFCVVKCELCSYRNRVDD